ncbi:MULTISPECIES: tRNA (adenosine(37)-N6)-threonylcarbamoyltransferase complex dimerization subunit type 1 TsaB [Legionella]|uniref:tRNA threonylcarbamoyladenosine biosynthesis protein TsaB n=1 Tax=Legionella resiliens TaxID=2905958 RepID=A0ABS8X6D2_9GAMM|nr:MULTISPECIES: tRNA (adenosine(37)-N6)-threonylcarbamoyltransferase complex dimerization subunit type 1 TsaB [unclassified Legionella]MCE0724136.1 tRNA (adenosine(37)-N6)-threonylcarbamoyltransferase complex dimerization subunit type 1 TsaB [Legionella sp. 9fVS26]MCE3533289.1 tRNA (adenosine(37)-N6)-threonylcarbamoyltransferase complex dimerization subunit type 1 TsaB [Legionella sp. 8cVS16]QLZ69468.1 tRNA (adenosine(37)-N6)-threonylcarbamoyltransferase complex dimerization subunit type 1 TsaB
MKLLAIDTSTEIASLALLTGEELLCEEQSNQKTHAQFILPMIDKLMVNAGLQMSQLDAIVFGRGPGSFTGLRIACSIAKGLAYANDLSLIPVSGLVAVAWSVRQQMQKNNLPVLAVLDARMHEMYWAYFAEHQWTAEEYVTPVHKLSLPEKQSVILAGVGIDSYWDDVTPEVKSQISDKLTVYPSAAAMIQFARFSAQKPIVAAQAQPVYVRNKVT